MATKAVADANKVKGFSERFNVLLDRSDAPKKNRVSYGAKRFDVAHNTFKGWCVEDTIPRRHAFLVTVVADLLQDITGSFNVHSVVAWLLAGDAVPNPFEAEGDALELVEIFLEVSAIARKNGIEFDRLPREARQLILNKARTLITDDPDSSTESDGRLRLDESAIHIIESLLAMAKTLKS